MSPKVVITTERLTLTSLTATDAAEVFRYRVDPEVQKYQTWAPQSLDEVLRFINDLQSVAFDTPGTWYQLGIRLKTSGSWLAMPVFTSRWMSDTKPKSALRSPLINKGREWRRRRLKE